MQGQTLFSSVSVGSIAIVGSRIQANNIRSLFHMLFYGVTGVYVSTQVLNLLGDFSLLGKPSYTAFP